MTKKQYENKLRTFEKKVKLQTGLVLNFQVEDVDMYKSVATFGDHQLINIKQLDGHIFNY